MKKQILQLSAAGLLAASSAHAGLAPGDVVGDFIAGWDFAEVANVSTDANSYASDVGTSAQPGGTLTTSVAPISVAGTNNVQFSSFGRGVSSTSYRGFNGFATRTTRGIGDTQTGQQSLQFNEINSPFSLTLGLNTPVDDALVEFDYMLDGTSFDQGFGDFMDVFYSTDSGGSFTAYAPNSVDSTVASNSYAAFQSPDGSWRESTSPGTHSFTDGQDNALIDLAGISGVDAIRFDVAAGNGSDSIFFDNIAVTGTAVPEPGAFAAIAGVLALGFTAVRRRRS